jgi:ATP-dependent exoDNAse (exonuclease V) beta subunit
MARLLMWLASEEEARLLYVAMTRATAQLVVTGAEKRQAG